MAESKPQMDDTASDSGSETSTKTPESMETLEDQAPTTKVVDEEVTPTPGTSAGTSGGATATVSSIEKLLQQQRNEIMFELRRLQLGERPVTGQGNKEAVESFFTAQIAGQGPEELERERPENVVVEVNALVERRPVSSLLQSNRFRRTLENALRSAITTASPSSQAGNQSQPISFLQRQLNQRQQTSSPTPSASQGRSNPPAPASLNLPRPLRYASPATSNHSSQESVPSFTSTPAVPGPPPPFPGQAAAVVPPASGRDVPLPPPPPAIGGHQAQEQVAPWLQQIVQQGSADGIPLTWAQIEEAQREGFIFEISELVQRQLVTETLSGGFRNTLERMMEVRAARAGQDGTRVQQFVQSLNPTTHHMRNDFSELGIIPPDQQQALSDDVSVISATAAVTVNNAHQNAAMSREMSSLKAQISELKNMMKLSFDMQLDTQRAIRQEVAAAMAQALGNTESTYTPSPPRGTAPVDDAQCLICLDKTADSVLYQCGHLCVCNGCGIELKQRGHHCPVCRAPIRDIIRAYKSGAPKP